jgi:hypothetical protein
MDTQRRLVEHASLNSGFLVEMRADLPQIRPEQIEVVLEEVEHILVIDVGAVLVCEHVPEAGSLGHPSSTRLVENTLRGEEPKHVAFVSGTVSPLA